MTTLIPTPSQPKHFDPEAAAGPQLIGSRCADCSMLVFPPQDYCPACASPNVTPTRLSRDGKLYTYSVVHIAPKGWQAPYVIGYVDLPEGVRVFSHISVGDTRQLQHDMPVRLALGILRTDELGQPVPSFLFVPAPNQST